jgi:hypothetical protein
MTIQSTSAANGSSQRRGMLAVIETEPRRRGPDRTRDRRVTFAGLVVAVLFLIAAAISLALPPGTRLGWWLPLHLALAGALARHSRRWDGHPTPRSRISCRRSAQSCSLPVRRGWPRRRSGRCDARLARGAP